MSINLLHKKKKNYGLALTVFLTLLMSTKINAQDKISISGTVIDETGLIMAGVNVVEKGKNNFATTDFDGKFKIQVVGPKSVLTFSFIG